MIIEEVYDCNYINIFFKFKLYTYINKMCIFILEKEDYIYFYEEI